MTDFFMSIQFLEEQKAGSTKLPSLEDLVLLFETLDSDKDGLLSYADIRVFVEEIDSLQQVQFNLDRYINEYDEST